jgi:hypothetical protein
MGMILDWPRFPRSVRAKLGWAVLALLTFSIWGGGYAFQKWADSIHKIGWLDFSASKICECSMIQNER